MAEQNEGADKTEQPTSKKLKDARKEGNVSKSRELTSTVLVMGWLVGGWLLMGFMFRRVRGLFDQTLEVLNQPFEAGGGEAGVGRDTAHAVSAGVRGCRSWRRWRDSNAGATCGLSRAGPRGARRGRRSPAST